MKLTLKCLAIFVIALHLKVCCTKQSLTPFAVKEYIEEHLIKNAIKFEVIYNSKAQKLLDKTLKLISDVKSYRITQVDSRIRPNGRNYFDLDFSAVLFFDSFKNYLRFEERINVTCKGPQDRNFFIVCANVSTSEIERNIPKDKFQIRQYLIEEKGKISLKATTLFTPRACHKQQLIEINQFSGKKLKWKLTKFSMSKIDNFYGCTLSIAFYETRLLSCLFRSNCLNDELCELIVVGYRFKLVLALAEDLNFKVDGYFRNSQYPYFIFWNGSDGTIKKFKSSVNFDWQPFEISIIHHHFYRGMISSPIISESKMIIVPPGAAYTSEEKFLLPFDTMTWIMFATVFVVAFVVVGLLRIFKSPSITSFVHGENVSNPGLNIIGVFMGIGQFVLPTRSIARILLMIFIIFCLIMRTAYQGVYYNFLTTDPHKNPIKSIEELLDSKFPLYRQQNTPTSEIEEDFVGKFHVIDLSSEELEPVLSQLNEPAFKGAALYVNEFFDFYNARSDRSSRPKFIKIDDVFILSYNMGIYFEPDSFLFKSFDKLITAYLKSGLFEKWITDQTKHVEITAKVPSKAHRSSLSISYPQDSNSGLALFCCRQSPLLGNFATSGHQKFGDV